MKTIKSQRGHRRGAVLSLATAAILALPAGAAPQILMRIADHDGSVLVPGEHAAEPYAEWIDLLAFGQGMNQLSDTLRCDHTGFSFIKKLDKSTPKISEALCKGRVFPKVEILYLSDESHAPGLEPVRVELHHVQVINHRIGNGSLNPLGDSGSAGELPTEEVTLGYSEVRWLYRQHDENNNVVDESNAILTAFLGTEDPQFDDDNDGIPNDLDQDDDNDGVSDPVELAGGTNPFRNDAEEDLDGDGQSNGAEAVANTRANDSSDYFGIEGILFRKTPDGPRAIVSIPVTGGRHYRLLASPDPSLPKDFWFVLDEFDMPHGSPESGADIELDAAMLRNASQLFFRAEVSLMENPVLPDPVVPTPVDPIDPVGPNPVDPIPGPAPTPIR